MEVVKRVLSSIVLAAFVIIALYLYDAYYWAAIALLIYVAAILGLIEYYRLVHRDMNGSPLRYVGYVFTTLLVFAAYSEFLHLQTFRPLSDMPQYLYAPVHFFYPDRSLISLVVVFFLMTTMAAQLLYRPIDGAIYTTAVTLFGPIYTVLTLIHVFYYLEWKNALFYLVFVIVATTMSDIGAYFAGRMFGKHNAGLKVSPKKTYEGYVGGIILSVVASNIFVAGWNAALPGSAVDITIMELSFLAAFLSSVSVLGDLSESLIKRDAKQKDSASIIPGHGGMLDLADALLFTFPAAYYYLLMKSKLGFLI